MRSTESSNSSITKAVDRRSLSIFGGNFVFAKVHWGLISVRCLELRGVHFLEVQNVLVLWQNQSGASEPSIVQKLSGLLLEVLLYAEPT